MDAAASLRLRDVCLTNWVNLRNEGCYVRSHHFV